MKHADQEERQHRGHRSVKGLAMSLCPPWLGWILLFPVGSISHLLWSGRGNSTTGVFAVIALGTVALVGMTHRLALARGDVVRKLAMSSVAAGGCWELAALLFGPWNHPWLDAWLLGGIVPLAWNIHHALRSKGEGGDPASPLAAALAGARVRKATVDQTRVGPVVRARVEVDRGEQTVKDLQGQATHIETVTGLRPGSVLTTQDPDDAGMANMIVTPHDNLAETIPFAPDRPGESIALPIRIGPYVDGAECEIHLPGSEKERRNLAHVLTNGVTGSGKSALVCQLMAKAACRTEVALIGMDPVKGSQSFGPFVRAGAMELIATDLGSCKALQSAIKRCVKVRASWLGEHGFKQWESGCGLTFLIVWYEEANWATQSDALTTLAEQCRSAGILLLVSQQRASYSKVDTDLRANLTAGISMGVANSLDAKFCLPDEVVDVVGDMLESWGNRKPGYAIVNHPSIADAARVKPVRSEYATDDELEEMMIEFAPCRTPIDDVTRQALGATYDRVRAVMAGATPPPAPRDIDSDMDDFPNDEPDDDAEDDSDMPHEPADLSEDDISDIDPTKPITTVIDAGGAVIGDGLPPRPEMSTEDARALVERHLRALLLDGKTEVTAADVALMNPPVPRKRTWVRSELLRRCTEAGPNEVALERDDDMPPGTYTMIAPALAHAALSNAP